MAKSSSAKASSSSKAKASKASSSNNAAKIASVVLIVAIVLSGTFLLYSLNRLERELSTSTEPVSEYLV